MKVFKIQKRKDDILSSLLLLIFLVAFFIHMRAAQAQTVYTLNGGTSSFTQTQGGWATLQTKNYTMEFGGGTMYGDWGVGGVIRRPYRGTIYSLGDTLQTIYMPTDLFSNGRAVFMTGYGMDTTYRDGRTDSHLYLGGISNFFEGQFFSGAHPQRAAGLWIFNGKTGEMRNWRFTQQLLVSSHSTIMEGVQWSSRRNTGINFTTLSASVGLSNMHNRYGAVSAIVRWRSLDLRAEYVAYGKRNTPLLYLPTLQYGEPVKENVSINYHPFRFLQIHGSRRNLLAFPSMFVSADQAGDINTADSAGATLRLLKTSLSGTYFDSKYRGQSSHGESVSVSRSITRYAMLGASYGRSYSSLAPMQKLSTVFVMERITPQWNLRQTYVHENGQSFMTYGGEYFSNRITAGVYYNTTYIPTNIARPYQPNYSFNGTFKLTNRISISGSKSIDPYGKGYYIASASLSSYSTNWTGNMPAIKIGDFAVRGQVITPDNQPVSGIAIQIDKALIYTDMNGNFELREKNKKSHAITVIPSLSTTQLTYDVISAPSRIESTGDDEPGITIVVKLTNKARGAAQIYKEHQQVTGQAQNSHPSLPAAPASAASASASASTLSPAPSAVNSQKPTDGATSTSTQTYGAYVPYRTVASAVSNHAEGITGQE
ncbi:MAG: hypothetical protein FWD64_00530 [Acidobacteriaceae bacterium]|nr:hypothetical protein [Acidobacteriaceae bacterium]